MAKSFAWSVRAGRLLSSFIVLRQPLDAKPDVFYGVALTKRDSKTLTVPRSLVSHMDCFFFFSTSRPMLLPAAVLSLSLSLCRSETQLLEKQQRQHTACPFPLQAKENEKQVQKRVWGRREDA